MLIRFYKGREPRLLLSEHKFNAYITVECTYSHSREEAVDKELTISNVKDSKDESAVCASLIVTLEQNTSDTLEVTNPSATSLLIKLADTTAVSTPL